MTPTEEPDMRGQNMGDSLAEPGSRPADRAPAGLDASRFDPARVRRLLEALAPLCAVVADYATSAGPNHDAGDRVLGRIARGTAPTPYVTWGQICAIEDAAYELARLSGMELIAAIAMEARQGGDGENSAPSEGRQRGPERHRQTESEDAQPSPPRNIK